MIKNQNFFFWAITIITIYLLFETASSAGLFILKKLKNVSYQPTRLKLSAKERDAIKLLIKKNQGIKRIRKFSATLGWTNRPSSQNQNNSIRINAQGIRGDKEYSLVHVNNKIRILSFGDSYTFGAIVKDEDVWSEKLTLLNSRFEILNFGVAGYGLDQAYLRYKEEGVRFNPRIVFIGYMTENINRQVNVFRPFYIKSEFMPVSKPRFIIKSNELKLLENPLSRLSDYEELLSNEKTVLSKLGKHDYFYQTSYSKGNFGFLPSIRIFKILHKSLSARFSDNEILKSGLYNTKSEAFKITTMIFKRFYNNVLLDDAISIILIFPHFDDICNYRKDKIKAYAPLIKFFKRNGFRYVDLMDAFVEFGHSYEVVDFFEEGHYTPLGNVLVAKYLSRYLNEQALK